MYHIRRTTNVFHDVIHIFCCFNILKKFRHLEFRCINEGVFPNRNYIQKLTQFKEKSFGHSFCELSAKNLNG